MSYITIEQVTAAAVNYTVEIAARGPAASIEIGTVTTGAAGTSATVTNSGTGAAAVLDFTIPRGATGADGGAGVTSVAGRTGVVTITSADLTDSTAAGRSVLTAADAAAQAALLPAVVGDSGSGGTKGLVPAPAAGDAAASKFLKADGTWVAVTSGVTSVAGRSGAVTLTTADLTDSTTAGRALVTAADAAAQRTALGLGTAALSASSAFQSAYSFTLSGTSGQTYTLPSTSATMARTDAAQTFSGIQTLSDRLIVSVNGALSAPGAYLTGTWITGGTSTTTKPYFLIEPTGTSSTTWPTTGTAIGVNAASGFSGRFIHLMASNVVVFSVNSGGGVTCAGLSASSVSISTNAGVFTLGASSDCTLSRNSVANIRQGAADAAAPVAQTSSVQSVVAGTSNTAGVTRTYAGSQSTGNQVGGGHVFQTSPAGSSGTAQNALVTAFTINGDGSTTHSMVSVLKNYTVATLPTASSYTYGRAFVSDASAPTFGSTVAGGGAVKVPVYSDGSNWLVG